MKSTFKIGSVEVQGVKLNDIEFTQEYTATEAIQLLNAGKEFVQTLLKELPEMVQDAAKVEKVVDEVSPEFGKSFDIPAVKFNGREISFTDLPDDIQALLIHMQSHRR